MIQLEKKSTYNIVAVANEDVMGLALLDYFNEDYTKDIVVHSSITEDDIIPLPYLFRTENQLSKIEQKALQLCRGKVLDVGAGSGCHSVILQENDVQVTAIDVSKGAVEVMRKRGLNAQTIDFFDVTGQYDTLLFLMNGAGIAGTLEGLKFFLQKGKSLLKAGGRILFDSSDIFYMYQEEDGSHWENLNQAYYGEVTYQMEYKGVQSASFNWLFVDFKTLFKIANELDFSCQLVMEGDHSDYLAQLTLKG